MKFLVLLIMLISCGKKSDVTFYELSEKSYQKFVNQKSLMTKPDLVVDKFIINREYPFEIALYQDGRWYYNLPRLDEGYGTWKYENGSIVLYAKRDLFDMHIKIRSINELASQVAITFADRFGPQVLEMENRNITQ